MAFPEALKKSPGPLKVSGSRATWCRPVDLATLLALKEQQPTAKMAAGNTEVGIETKWPGVLSGAYIYHYFGIKTIYLYLVYVFFLHLTS